MTYGHMYAYVAYIGNTLFPDAGLLGQDSSSGKVRAIGFDAEWGGIVRRGQYQSGSNCKF